VARRLLQIGGMTKMKQQRGFALSGVELAAVRGGGDIIVADWVINGDPTTNGSTKTTKK
jgi:hypothetical protein